jgi:hypothetical protein
VSLFAELRRRKVIRVAVVYAATAFAVLQAADIMLPQMNVPEWGMGLLVAFVVFGFPIALVLAWALEVTPEGSASPKRCRRCRPRRRRCSASAPCWRAPCSWPWVSAWARDGS